MQRFWLMISVILFPYSHLSYSSPLIGFDYGATSISYDERDWGWTGSIREQSDISLNGIVGYQLNEEWALEARVSRYQWSEQKAPRSFDTALTHQPQHSTVNAHQWSLAPTYRWPITGGWSLLSQTGFTYTHYHFSLDESQPYRERKWGGIFGIELNYHASPTLSLGIRVSHHADHLTRTGNVNLVMRYFFNPSSLSDNGICSTCDW